MNIRNALLDQTLAERVGWTLLHSLWQGALIGIAFALVRLALRQRSAEARYLAGCLGLALMLAAPSLTFWLGPTPFGQAGSGGLPAGFLPQGAAPRWPPALPRAVHVSSGSWLTIQWLAEWCGQLAPILTAAWLAGVAIFSLRLARGWWWVRSLRTREIWPVELAWVEVLDDLRCRLEISRPVRLLKSALVQVPTVVGWLRPAILLPAASLTGLSAPELEAILAHELAHVRRLDYVVNAFQCLIETLMFYHPVVWWLSRCVREERENCCDDLVLKVCSDRIIYARALTALEAIRAEIPQFAFAANAGSLLNRIRRMVGASEQAAPATARQAAGLGLIGIGLICIVLGLHVHFTPSSYCAVARMKIQPELPTAGLPVYDPYFLQIEMQTMSSEPVLRGVVEELHLATAWSKKGAGGRPLSISEAIAILNSRMELRPIRNTPFIEICASGAQPEEAARIANAIAQAYQQHRLDKRRQSGGLQALEERWRQQDAKIHLAAEKVEQIRKESKIPDAIAQDADLSLPRHGTRSLDIAERLRKIESLRIETQAELVRQQSLLDHLKALSPQQLTQVVPTAAPDALLNSLIEQRTLAEQNLLGFKLQMGPEHPDVVRVKAQRDDLQERILRRQDGLLLGLEVKAASLQRGLENLEKESARVLQEDAVSTERFQPYLEARRELDELQRFGQALRMKLATEQLELSFPKTNLVEIIDEARPPLRPSSPNRAAASALVFLGLLLDLAGLRLLVDRR